MPDLPPEIELILRAGEACSPAMRGKVALPGLAAALAAVAALELPASIARVQRAAAGLLEAAPAKRAEWLALLEQALGGLGDAERQPNPDLVAAWTRRADIGGGDPP